VRIGLGNQIVPQCIHDWKSLIQYPCSLEKHMIYIVTKRRKKNIWYTILQLLFFYIILLSNIFFSTISWICFGYQLWHYDSSSFLLQLRGIEHIYDIEKYRGKGYLFSYPCQKKKLFTHPFKEKKFFYVLPIRKEFPEA
jgi:hypothetical protein